MTAQEIQTAWMVGDHPRDLAAGHAFGCRLALVGTGRDDEFLQPPSVPPKTVIFTDLRETVDFLIDTQG